jgi:hypothetical protein
LLPREVEPLVIQRELLLLELVPPALELDLRGRRGGDGRWRRIARAPMRNQSLLADDDAPRSDAAR